MAVVFSIAQRIAVLHQGRLIAEGTPAQVRSDLEVRRIYLEGRKVTAAQRGSRIEGGVPAGLTGRACGLRSLTRTRCECARCR
ncbi:MAG: hypothetical protein ABIP08_11400 [Lautropia sp.]